MREIQFETDFNHKLLSDTFVHVTQAPVNPVPESALEAPILVTLKDNPDFRTTVRLMDLQRLPLGQLKNIYTLPSHGLVAVEFIDWWLKKYPNADADTPMAVYYYQKEKCSIL